MDRFTSKQTEITILITIGEKRYLDTFGFSFWLNIAYKKIDFLSTNMVYDTKQD